MYDRGIAILFPTVFLYPDPFSTIEQNFHIFARVSQYAMNPCLDTRYKRTLCLLRYGIVGQRLFSGSINIRKSYVRIISFSQKMNGWPLRVKSR